MPKCWFEIADLTGNVFPNITLTPYQVNAFRRIKVQIFTVRLNIRQFSLMEYF